MRNEEIRAQQLLWSAGDARHRRSAPDLGDRSAGPDVAGSANAVGSAPRRFVVSSARRRAFACVTIVGELDATATVQFRAQVATLVDEGARSVVVDLAAAEVDDAAGLAALVDASEHLDQHGGELLLRSPHSRTLQALDRAGLSDAFPIC